MRGSATGCDSSQLEGQSISIQRNTAIIHAHSLGATHFTEEPCAIEERA
jgi:hypothetical protein